MAIPPIKGVTVDSSSNIRIGTITTRGNIEPLTVGKSHGVSVNEIDADLVSPPTAQTSNDDEGPTNYRSIHRHWIRPVAVGVLIIALGGIVFIWMTGSPPPK